MYRVSIVDRVWKIQNVLLQIWHLFLKYNIEKIKYIFIDLGLLCFKAIKPQVIYNNLFIKSIPHSLLYEYANRIFVYKAPCLKLLYFNRSQSLVNWAENSNYQEIKLHWQEINCYISTIWNKENTYYQTLLKVSQFNGYCSSHI